MLETVPFREPPICAFDGCRQPIEDGNGVLYVGGLVHQKCEEAYRRRNSPPECGMPIAVRYQSAVAAASA